MTARRPIAVWLDPAQIDLVRAVATQAKCTIVAAGSDARGARGQSAAVAQALDASTLDDLRNALISADVDLVWIASPGEFGRNPEDARAIAAARARGVRVASGEPIPASILELAPAGWTSTSGGPAPSEAIRFLGLPRFSRPFRDASEVLTAFATPTAPRSAVIECWSGPQHGTLASRLFAALDTLRSLMGEPESLLASYTTPDALLAPTAPGTASLAVNRAQPPEDLRQLQGDLIATARYDSGRTASIITSNHAGRWNTIVTLLSSQGRLRIYDDGFEWLAPDGQKRDELRIRKANRGDPTLTLHGVAALADDLARLTDPSLPDDGPTEITSLLAMTQAALLSARTGHSESPAAIRAMVGGRTG